MTGASPTDATAWEAFPSVLKLLTRLTAQARQLRQAWHGLPAELRVTGLPVLRLEMRRRMRGPRAFVIMFVCNVVLAALAAVTAWQVVVRYGNVSPGARIPWSLVGEIVFGVVSVGQLLAILLVVPPFGAYSIASERENGTFDLLAVSRMSSASIVVQKIAGTMAEPTLMLMSSLPIVAAVFTIGGVSPGQVVAVLLLNLVTTLQLSSATVAGSCFFKSTRASVFVAYLLAVVSTVGAPIGLFPPVALEEVLGDFGIQSTTSSSGSYDPSPVLVPIMQLFWTVACAVAATQRLELVRRGVEGRYAGGHRGLAS